MARRRRKTSTPIHLLIGDERKVRDSLWRYLEDDRRTLRRVCRALNDTATRHVGQLFRNLYVRAPTPDKDGNAVRVVGPLCHHLTITVGRHADTPGNQKMTSRGSFSSLLDRHDQSLSLSRHLWIGLLSSFHQLRMLTIRVHGGKPCSLRTEYEETLVTLRIAVEQNRLPQLKALTLAPIHAFGVIRLRWSGFGAFGSLRTSSGVWRNIETLDLRILSPFAAGAPIDDDCIMFKKGLYEYLRSFGETLRVLRMTWLDSQGPSPLTLHHEPGLEGRLPIRWGTLEELWTGNIAMPFQTIRLVKHLVPSLKSMKMLRSTHRESGLVAASDSSAWMDVDLDAEVQRHSQASSVYSQEPELSVDPRRGVSLSSRSIMVWKDF